MQNFKIDNNPNHETVNIKNESQVWDFKKLFLFCDFFLIPWDIVQISSECRISDPYYLTQNYYVVLSPMTFSSSLQ